MPEKNGGNVPSLKVVEVVLEQHNLVNNQYQQKPEHPINLMLICLMLNQAI